MKFYDFIFLAGIAVLLVSCLGLGRRDSVETAKNVDIARYMGRWFEIARFENSFEKGLANVSAVYTLNGDNTVSVVNSGVKPDGEKTSVSGRAYAPDSSDFSKLRVSFFRPFYGDYYILELDGDYRWALVGGRDKSYLWILSRTPRIPEAELSKILEKARSRGYDAGRLMFPNGH